MPTLATAGHGASIGMELDPTGSPGTFTAIAELNGDIQWPGLGRGEAEATGHDHNIDYWVSGSLRREPFTFSMNFVYNHGTHDHLTGLHDAVISNETRGFRLRGPGGTDDTDEWICSGFVTNIQQTSPVREGVRTADVTIRMTGPQIIDGVEYGA